MAAGDRNKQGKPIDVVRHYKIDDKTICGRINWSYATNDINDVTCIKCIKALKKSKDIL